VFIGFSVIYFTTFSKTTVDITGYIANIFDASVAVPQLIANANNKYIKNLSLVMIGGWFVGDGAKTGFYFWKGMPLPFKCGGIFACLMDFFVCCQYFYYDHVTDEKGMEMSGNEYFGQANVKGEVIGNTIKPASL